MLAIQCFCPQCADILVLLTVSDRYIFFVDLLDWYMRKHRSIILLIVVPGTDPENLRGEWLDTRTAAKGSNGCLLWSSRGVWGMLPRKILKFPVL